MRKHSLLLLAFLVLSACRPARAEAHPHRFAEPPLATAPVVQGPYRIELVDEAGAPLSTWRLNGRTYVLGEKGRRYRVRIVNPTSTRVEAVLSIDGLDAVDGRTADFRIKRGYLVQPYGQIEVDGFRVSMDDVATFRFSSVGRSYAGRKGRARNVGVIGAAFFAERPLPPPQPVLVPEEYPEPYMSRDEARGRAAESEAPSSSAAGAPAMKRSAPGQRPGLGTEFGERRTSRVSYQAFERADATRPTQVVELRYNDRGGLGALGVRIEPEPVPDELELRETASPFAGSY